MAEEVNRTSLSEQSAFQLANVTKTAPQFGAITPRWLVRLLDWKPLESGTMRLNKVDESKAIESLCAHEDESPLPSTFVDYHAAPREYRLSSINAVLNVHTRVSDLLNNPFDQVREQLRLLVESVKEKQESELLNNADYGLLHNVAEGQKIKTRTGPPTPDDLDELLTKVWKEPSFFLAHPRTIAAFGRECTFRGVPPPTVTLFGTPFLTWRGVPLVPTDKIAVRSKDQQVEDSACACGREEAGRRRPVPAWTCRRTEPRPVRALHGHRPARARLLSCVAILLGGRAHRRCDWPPGRCGLGQSHEYK